MPRAAHSEMCRWAAAAARGSHWALQRPDFHLYGTAVDAAGAEANTVVHVMQKGYQIAERVLRPAMVVVAKG